MLPNQPIRGLGNQPGTVTTWPGTSYYSWPYYNSYVYPYTSGYGYYNNYYGDYYGNSYGPGYYDSSYYDPYGYPYRYGYWGPVIVPAETLYGPEAAKRFLGVNEAGNSIEPENDAHRRGAIAARDNRGNQKVRVRESNAEAKALAGKFIGYGDAYFAKRQFSQALSRYRTAGETAPDLAEPFLKQGFALSALGNYASATKSFRRALSLDENWWDSPLKLSKLYGQKADQKQARLDHLESVAEAVEQNPQDANLLTLLGLHLFFDDQQQRALTFFQRAEQLGANDTGELDRFLIARRNPAGAANDQDPIDAAKPQPAKPRVAAARPDRRNPPPPPEPRP
jgi:tetratricopeptide (TPR) repeat protein